MKLVQAFLIENSDEIPLTITAFDRSGPTSVPEGIVCQSFELPSQINLDDSKEAVIQYQIVYSDLMQPLPKALNQKAEQKMSFKDNLYVLMPYEVQSQTTKVISMKAIPSKA